MVGWTGVCVDRTGVSLIYPPSQKSKHPVQYVACSSQSLSLRLTNHSCSSEASRAHIAFMYCGESAGSDARLIDWQAVLEASLQPVLIVRSLCEMTDRAIPNLVVILTHGWFSTGKICMSRRERCRSHLLYPGLDSRAFDPPAISGYQVAFSSQFTLLSHDMPHGFAIEPNSRSALRLVK